MCVRQDRRGPGDTNFSWLAFSRVPLTVRQLRQTISIYEQSASAPRPDEDVGEFEECVVLACAGLVESYNAQPNPESPQGEPTLRFIHLSVQELIERESIAASTYSVSLSDQPNILSNTLGPDSRFPLAGQQRGNSSSRGHDIRRSPSPSPSPLVFQLLIPHPATANLDMALCCLKQLLYYCPAQPLSGGFNKRVSEEYMNKYHCFTLYTSVHWLGYLERCLEFEDELIFSTGSVMADLAKTFTTFLRQPHVLSAWLEAFYIAKYQRKNTGYSHPQAQVLRQWVKYISRACPKQHKWMLDSMPQQLLDFALDIENTVEMWHSQLNTSPEIVWDEMTYFVPSKFFFSPESIKVSVQEPDPPDYPNISPDPIAQMSRTSSDGRMKSVLSIWARECVDYCPSYVS